MLKLPVYGLVSALVSFVILQLSFMKPAWGRPLGTISLILGLLAMIFGIVGIARAIRAKAVGFPIVAFTIFDVILGALFGFYGLFVLVMT